MEEGRQLFLIMTDRKYRYCLYRVGDPQDYNGDETSVRNLEKPLLKMKMSTYPDLMSFTAIGSHIFMVGGCSDNGIDSNKVFFYDTMTSKVSSGPSLNSGKCAPNLLTLGSKIYALSDLIHCDRKNDALDAEPRFEMLDTEDLKRGWSKLPVPSLHISERESVYSVDALAAVYIGGGSSSSRGVIFISVSGAGTYAFDVDKEVWSYIGDQLLPFLGHALTIPHAPFLCCATSIESKRFSAFRFYYGGDESSSHEFQVDEIKIDTSQSHFQELPPHYLCYRPTLMVIGPVGRMYFVMSGVDNVEAVNTLVGNRYVKVSAFELSNVKLGLNEGQWLKRCSNKKMKIGHNENQDVTTKLYLNKGQSLKRCNNQKMKRGHDEEQDETVEELKLTGLWSVSFSGGPVCDPFEHVSAAIAM